ncbi:unnamed protein product, partial [Rhizoctonia solani]
HVIPQGHGLTGCIQAETQRQQSDMSFLTLRQSLARSREKIKQRFSFGSRSASPAPLDQNITLPISEPESGNQSGRSTMAWSGAKRLLAVLESSSGAFGPLKLAIEGLNKCIHIYESTAKGRKDYEELKQQLDVLLSDLTGHMAQPMDSMMTNSVKLLCSGIEKELNSNMATWRAVDELTMKESRLAKLLPAMSAMYNSAESASLERKGCVLGTRKPQIDLLMEWTGAPEAGRTCWMNGMAGTGKTTIAYSICSKLDEMSKLGASFFCSRSIPECRQVKNIIPTIAYQLARYSLSFQYVLAKTLESNPDTPSKALNIQYEKLIVEPLMLIQNSLPADFIVVIDALDECEEKSSLGQILDLLLTSSRDLPIRFLVSSRPEKEICRQMEGQVDQPRSSGLVLHDIESHAVRLDIEAYMRHELRGVPLTDTQWSCIIERCGVLFIYAATICRFIRQGFELKTLDEAVATIVNSASSPMEPGDEKIIDELYTTILEAALVRSEISQASKRKTRDLLETVICARKPLELGTLGSLIGLERSEQVEALLQPLRSVLKITGSTRLVTTLHASFPDYMLTAVRSNAFYCKQDIRHAAMAQACLHMIGAIDPKFNICGIASSHLLDNEIENLAEQSTQTISPELVYACRYWSIHLFLGEDQRPPVTAVHRFFEERLLVWMEMVNVTKQMSFGTSVIQYAEKWCRKMGVAADLVQLARDAGHFVSVYANHPVSQSTPHIYVSMLPFWPRTRPVSVAYMPRTSGLMEPKGAAITRRQPALLATWKISSALVSSISLSADGTRMVAAADDAIDILDTSTGEGPYQLT